MKIQNLWSRLIVTPTIFITSKWSERIHIGLVVTVIVMGGAAAATKSEAATVYTVSLTNNNNLMTQTDSSPNPLTRTFSTNANHTTAIGTGFAGNGTLTNDLSSNRNTNIFFANGSTTLTTTAAYDDIVFFDIANPTSTASAMVAVSADYTASSQTPGIIWNSTFEAFFNLAGSSFGTGPNSILNTSITDTLLSSLVSVTLNTPTSFSISGRLKNFLIFGSSSAGSGITINSNSTVTFPTFILPQGIGVSSETLGLPSAVPVPAALPLFLTGLAGLGFMRRRKRQASY